MEKKEDKKKKLEKKLEKFSDLLDSIDSLEDKRKHLWKEIYENAVTDREKASMLFTDIYQEICGNPTQHMTMGQNASKYLERMCRSNEQLIKLAEMISKTQEESQKIDFDEVYNSIEK